MFVKDSSQREFQLHVMLENLEIVCSDEESQFARAQMLELLGIGLPKCFY